MRPAWRKFLLAKHKMAEHEKSALWPFDRDAPLHGGLVTAKPLRRP